MKMTRSVLISFAAALALVACGQDKPAPKAEPAKKIEAPAPKMEEKKAETPAAGTPSAAAEAPKMEEKKAEEKK
jgi:PBP1b-binding outer membrane lipoprotein LpoB